MTRIVEVVPPKSVAVARVSSTSTSLVVVSSWSSRRQGTPARVYYQNVAREVTAGSHLKAKATKEAVGQFESKCIDQTSVRFERFATL